MTEPAAAPSRRWKGLTPDQRREQRREQLLDAGFEIVGSLGAGELGVRSVCRQAGLTERYFYENFADRESLLAALVDRSAAIGFARMDDARRLAVDAGDDPVEPMICAFLDFFEEDPRRGRVLIIEGRTAFPLGVPELPGPPRTTVLFTELLTASSPDEVDLALNVAALTGSQGELITRWLDGRLDVPKERLIRHLLAVFRAVQGLSSQADDDKRAI